MDVPILILLAISLTFQVLLFLRKPNYEEVTDEIEDVKSQNAKILLQIENLSKQIENARVTSDNLINNKFSDEKEYLNGKFAEEKDFLQNLKHDMFKENTEHNAY